MKSKEYDDIDACLRAIESWMRGEVVRDPEVQAAEVAVRAAEAKWAQVYREKLGQQRLECLKDLGGEAEFEKIRASAVRSGWRVQVVEQTRRYLLETSLTQILNVLPTPTRYPLGSPVMIFKRPDLEDAVPDTGGPIFEGAVDI